MVFLPAKASLELPVGALALGHKLLSANRCAVVRRGNRCRHRDRMAWCLSNHRRKSIFPIEYSPRIYVFFTEEGSHVRCPFQTRQTAVQGTPCSAPQRLSHSRKIGNDGETRPR